MDTLPQCQNQDHNDRNLKTASQDMALEKKSKNSRNVKYQVSSPKEFYSSRQKQRAPRPRLGECRVKKNKIGTGFIQLTGVRQDSILYTNGLEGKPRIPWNLRNSKKCILWCPWMCAEALRTLEALSKVNNPSLWSLFVWSWENDSTFLSLS